jgi:hypothetical protein
MLLPFDQAPDGTLLSKVFIVAGERQSQLGFKTPVDGFDENGNPDPSTQTYSFTPDPNQPDCPDDADILGYTPHE